MPGTLSINDLAKVLGSALPEKATCDTVPGFILHSVVHAPKLGEHVRYEGYRLVMQTVRCAGRKCTSVQRPTAHDE